MSFFPESGPLDSGPASSMLRELFGFIPRQFRVQGPIAEILEREAAMLTAVLGEDHLSRLQKERLLMAVSAVRRSSYGVALHEQMFKTLGGSEAEAVAIVEGRTPEGPDGALLRFARQLAGAPRELTGQDLEQLRRQGFTQPQIVEAIVVIGLGGFFNTMQHGTGARPDFAARPIPENILYHAPPSTRPIVETAAIAPIGEPLSDDPDTELVLRVQAGDVNAFEVLVERHSRRVYRTLLGLLGNPDEANDALQDTFLKAFQSLPGFERRARFSTWLVSIASNTGLQRIRERRPIDSLDEEGPGEDDFRPRQIRAWTDDPEQLFSKLQTRSLVEQCIMRLPAKYRVVVVLRDVQQMSTEEAAASLGLGIPALKARLLRGRLMLREALAPHFAAAPGEQYA